MRRVNIAKYLYGSLRIAKSQAYSRNHMHYSVGLLYPSDRPYLWVSEPWDWTVSSSRGVATDDYIASGGMTHCRTPPPPPLPPPTRTIDNSTPVV